MFEFCIAINKEKNKQIGYAFDCFSAFTKQFGGVVTKNEKEFCDNIEIAFAVYDYEKNRAIKLIQNVACNLICNFEKLDFLCRFIKKDDAFENFYNAYIYSLLYFDRETDKYIVFKHLIINKKLVLASFFDFMLAPLKEKWTELISISNSNNSYLKGSQSILELIKFLIDNIEIKCDFVTIKMIGAKYEVLDSEQNIIDTLLSFEKEEDKLIYNLIASCPKKINICVSSKLSNHFKNLVCKIFEKRVRFVSV